MLPELFNTLWNDQPLRRRLARLLIHPMVILAAATICATLAGAWLTNYYQEQAWRREQQFELFRYGFDQGLKVVDELSELTSRRLFGLNRVVWVAKGTGTGDLETAWNSYYETVEDWNIKLAVYKSRLQRFIGSEAAEAFLSADDAALSYQEGEPVSLHGQFLLAHQKVRALVDCVRRHCAAPEKQEALQAAQQQVNELGVAVEDFLRLCTENAYSAQDS